MAYVVVVVHLTAEHHMTNFAFLDRVYNISGGNYLKHVSLLYSYVNMLIDTEYR